MHSTSTSNSRTNSAYQVVPTFFLYSLIYWKCVLYSSFFFLMIRRPPRSTLFPTRRSSDLKSGACRRPARRCPDGPCPSRDRKSTRLNSSHQIISYAVFCLKKKKHQDLHINLYGVMNFITRLLLIHTTSIYQPPIQFSTQST